MGAHVDVPGDAYRLHRRPGAAQVVINDGRRGLLTVDPWSGERSPTIPYAASFTGAGRVSQWCFSGDGESALVIDAEDTTGCLLRLDGSGARELAVPFDAAADLRYAWRAGELWLTSGKGRSFFLLDPAQEHPGFVPRSRVGAHRAVPRWSAAMRSLPDDCAVERVDAGAERALFLRYGAEPALGVIDWSAEPSVRTVPYSGAVPRLAGAGDTFVVLDEFDLRVVGPDGTRVIPVEDGFEFADVDVVEAPDDGTPTIVALGSSSASPRTGRLWRYPLTLMK